MKLLYVLVPIFGLLSMSLSLKADDAVLPDDTVKNLYIDEVVVLSSSKETNALRTLPGAVSILSPQQIVQRQISSIKDISALVPNLYMPDYGAKLTSAIYIRGIGARSSGQSIGLYVDNAPYMDKSAFDFELTGIQHIEVLRGPQGTLYGRNAMGGIIAVHTLSPLDYQGLKASVSYGGYGQLNGKVAGYFKPADNLGLSVGVYYDRNDGFFTNACNGKRIDDEQTAGGNLKLVWQTSPYLKASYSTSFEYTEQGGFPYGRVISNAAGNANTSYHVAPVSMNDESSYRRSLTSHNLSLEYRNDNIMLTSVSGFQHLNDDMKMDQDFSDSSIFVLNQRQKQYAFTEEIAIRSHNDANYQWSTGVFGFYNRLHTDAPVDFKQDGITTIFQPVFDKLKADHPTMPGAITVTDTALHIPGRFLTPTYGVALYHQSTCNNLLIDGLSLTAGLRLDYEKQRLDYDSEARMSLSMKIQTNPSRPPVEMDLTDRYPASVIDERLHQSFKQLLPKASLKYEFTGKTFAYLSAAKGYKAGGYNVQMSADIMQSLMQYDVMNAFRDMMPDVEIVEPKPLKDVIAYRPETSWSWELGVRSRLIQDRLQAELTLFDMDVNDIQITKFVSGGNGRYLSNAGRAESYGLELSLQAVLTDALTSDLNYGYTHATFLDYDNERDDYSGNYIPYTPRHTFSLGLNYSQPLRACLMIDQLMASAQVNGAGKIYWTERNDVAQGFYSTVNAQIGVRKGAISLLLWGRNLTDTTYSTFYFESFNKPFMQRAKPFQAGITLKADI